MAFVGKFGLLGRKLGHSYSPAIHACLGNYEYSLYEREPEEIEDFLRNGPLDGMNVTVPYKKAVIPYLDELSPIAQKLGAVNTIVRRDGKLVGHNTDYFGFQMLLDTLPLAFEQDKVLVLGSGGASNTAVAVLRDRLAKVIVISRSGENNYSNLHLQRDARIIVNTTPVGMYPDTGKAPLDLKSFPLLRGVVDVIYNPARTQLILDAEALDGGEDWIHSRNGLLMLVAQAKEAAEWFTGLNISNDVIAPILNKLEADMQNIVLIGMPGCGKSTVGRILSEKTGRRFVDADAEIQRMAGKSIPEIFARDGEEAFRNWETKVLSELGKQSGLIIATGGGCVTRERNFPLLHQNGRIFWIMRNIKALPTDGRPLSQANSLAEMYRVRLPLYDKWKDLVIDNNGRPEEAAVRILCALEVGK